MRTVNLNKARKGTHYDLLTCDGSVKMPEFSQMTVADLMRQGYAVAVFPLPAITDAARPARRRRSYLQAPSRGDRLDAWIKIKDAGRPLHITEIAPNDEKKQHSLSGSIRQAVKKGRYF